MSEESFYELSPKFGIQRSHGKAKTKFKSRDLYLIFKVTNVIQDGNICKMVSTYYLRKYMTYLHEISYTEARG